MRIFVVQFGFEPAEGSTALDGPCQSPTGFLVGDLFCEVGHVLVPDVGRQRIDADQVQLVEVHRCLAIDAGVGRPEHDFTSLWVDQPPVLVVGLVRQCGGDLLKVEAVQIKHRTTVVRAARYSRQVCPESAGLPAGPLADAGLIRTTRWLVVPVVSPGQDDWVLIVCATKKLLQRIGPPTLLEGEQSTTLLGQWYATALFWKPQIALLVNEPTLLPVLMPLAPAATWPARIAQQVAVVLTAHGIPTTVIDEELRHMRDCRLARTTNRSVVGIMNEFTHLAGAYRDHHPGKDLLDLAMWLATTPCGPLYAKNISPDRELAAFLRSIAT